MTNLAALHKRARKAAERRGHDLLGWFVVNGHESYLQCSKCRKRVYVNTRPLPNEIDISGEAVALGCVEA